MTGFKRVVQSYGQSDATRNPERAAMKEQIARQGNADLKRGQGRKAFWMDNSDDWTLNYTLLLSRQTILEISA